MNILKPALQLILLTGACIGSSYSFAEMYKWVDAEGNTQYTQQPPPDGIEGQEVKPPPKVDTESAVEEFNQQEEAYNKQRGEKLKQGEEAMKTADEEAEHQAKCDRARQQLEDLQRPRITTTDAEGNRARMPEEERLATIQKLNESIAKDCN